jgi:FlaA1/EpsC-like NDP-sugar epimerase
MDSGERRSTDAGWRLSTVVVSDLLAWVIGLAAARTFYEIDNASDTAFTITIIAVGLQLGVGYASGLYRGHLRQFSFDEAGVVAVIAGGIGLALIALEYQLDNAGSGGQLIIIATSLAVCTMFGHRYLRRLRARRVQAKASQDRTAVIVYGAGEGAERAISAMQSVANSAYRPVALVDDNTAKRKCRIRGVRVVGTGDDLEAVAHRYGATAVLLAMPAATGSDLQVLNQRVRSAGLDTLVMPPLQRLVGEGSPLEISRYTDEDVLNRGIVAIDSAAVAALVAGRRVLVTGAGGSIGSELVRQLSAFLPASLIALDRDDSLLHAVIATLEPQHRKVCTPVLADIRDIDRLDDVFDRHRPQLVFHAAALKHVPALEGAPSEGWKTNVLGSGNVVSVSERHGVERVVNISTDKAANPANVLGYTKRIAERLTAAAAARTGREFVSVRFGNVIGSRGSALETFSQQIEQGGPVTVTHPDVTRYFMAVREAVRLTMQAAAIGRPGEVLVLDMGTPMNVLDVAQQLIDRSGRDVEIVFTGMRPGEKMHEELLGDGEGADRPFHPMIDHVDVAPLTLADALDSCAAIGVSAQSLAGLKAIAECDVIDHRVNLSHRDLLEDRTMPFRRES